MLKLLKGSVLTAALLAASASHAAYLGTFSGTFESIQDPVCYTLYGAFSVGGQYLDANNGVTDYEHSMLARWQGDNFVTNSVGYDMGRWNGAHITPQRGYQPESPSLASGGASVYCVDFGMLLNTKFNAHRPIVGGGYDDMYGYSWPAGSGPRPFTKNGSPTHLVLQANVGLASYDVTGPGGGRDLTQGSGQVALFAYLRDTTHPFLPPIVILAATHAYNGSNSTVPGLDSCSPGCIAAFDYNQVISAAAAPAYPAWLSGMDSDSGVWFVTGPISVDPSNHNDFVSTYFTDGQTSVISTSATDAGGNPSMPFFRAHIRPEDWVNTINAIANHPCAGKPHCPDKGYSTIPADYELAYAGLIAETTIIRDNMGLNADGTAALPSNPDFDTSPSVWMANDSTKPQVILGVHGNALGIYRGIP